jgi:arylsulfatase
MQRYTVAADKPLSPGKAMIRFEFAYDGGGLGKGGMGTLYVNDKKVAEGRIEHTQPMIFSADETADVGIDLGTPVVEAIGAERASKFTGKIHKVTIEVKEMKKADKAEEDALHAEAAHKKAMSD